MSAQQQHGDSDDDWTQLKFSLADYPRAGPTQPPNAEKMYSYGVNIAVDSIAYLKSDETPGTSWAAIQLTLTLKSTKFVKVEEIAVALYLQLSEGSSTTGKRTSTFDISKLYSRRETPPTQPIKILELPFYYPCDEESVEIHQEKHKHEKSTTLSPRIDVEVMDVGIGGELGSKTKADTHTSIPRISRKGMTIIASDATRVGLRWSFCNLNSTHYPASHKTIVLLRCDPKTTDVPSFTFEILVDNLEVTQHNKEHRCEVGWKSSIRGNYYPRKVDQLLRSYRDGTEEANKITLAALARGETINK